MRTEKENFSLIAQLLNVKLSLLDSFGFIQLFHN